MFHVVAKFRIPVECGHQMGVCTDSYDESAIISTKIQFSPSCAWSELMKYRVIQPHPFDAMFKSDFYALPWC